MVFPFSGVRVWEGGWACVKMVARKRAQNSMSNMDECRGEREETQPLRRQTAAIIREWIWNRLKNYHSQRNRDTNQYRVRKQNNIICKFVVYGWTYNLKNYLKLKKNY